jgi:Hemerythrin HHE cation binding domain
MNTLTQPLRDEHKELIPHIEQILKVANSIPDAPLEEVREGVKDVYEFLAYHLIPHAQAEDAALYPAVQKALGSPDATRTMSRDHVEVGRYIEELAGLSQEVSPQNFKALQRILYGLYALSICPSSRRDSLLRKQRRCSKRWNAPRARPSTLCMPIEIKRKFLKDTDGLSSVFLFVL